MFTKFEELWRVVEEFNVDKDVQKTIVSLKNDGKSISLGDKDLILADGGGLYYILSDGTLTKQSLYLSDEDINKLKSLNPINQEELPKYHIFNCGVLRELKNSKKNRNYKISLRDDGTFHFLFTDKESVIKEVKNQTLQICPNCLRIYNKMKNTNFSPKEFSLQKFVKNYTTCFGGLNIDSLEYSTYYKESELTKDWHFLSTKMKEKREYSCEKCGFKAQNSYQKKFLHTHHISSDKTYSNFDRLKVLCVACHSIEHNDIKKTSVYSEFIKIK